MCQNLLTILVSNKPFQSEIIIQEYFRDNGIVISISIIQWIAELIHNAIFYFYIFLLVGYSNTFDKFFNLYLITIMVIILPSFYLNGEAAFRRNLVVHGPFKAMKNVIVGKMWITQENNLWTLPKTILITLSTIVLFWT